MLEKTLESPLDCMEIQPVHPKGNQSRIFIVGTDTEAETPILYSHLMRRTDSLKKTLMLGKIEGRRRRGWQRMRWLDGITNLKDRLEFEQALGVGDQQGSLACCSLMGLQRVGHDQVTELLKALKSYWSLTKSSSYPTQSRAMVLQRVWVLDVQPLELPMEFFLCTLGILI